MRRVLTIAWVISVIPIFLTATEWTQYRGPNHDGVSTDVIRTNWSEVPLRQVWRVPLDPALSSFTISGGRVYTQVRRRLSGQEREFCVALDAETGQEVWARALDVADYPDGGVGNDDGPRSTPSVAGARVFVLTSYLQLACLDAVTGEKIWGKDLPAEYGSSVIQWQNAASPVIEGDLVIINGNGPQNQCLMAFHTSNGSLAWKGFNDRMTQASPVAATIAGVRQVIFFTQSGLVSVAPQTGRLLWRHTVRYNGISVAASPVVSGNLVYCSRAYPRDAGALVIRVTESGGNFATSEVWAKPNQLMNHWATPVEFQGHLYGMFGQNNLNFKCIELATGQEKWSVQGFGYGSVLVVNQKILALAASGEMVLVDRNPEAYTEIDRFRPVTGKCWNVAAVSNGRIYVRSTTQGACFDASTKSLAKLKLFAPVAGESGRFQLVIRPEDGSSIDASRIPNIDLFTTSDLTIDPTRWTKLGSSGVLTDGAVRFDHSEDSTASHRFFRAEERP